MGTLADALTGPMVGTDGRAAEAEKGSAGSIARAWDSWVDLARASLLGTAPIAPLVAAVIALAAQLSGTMVSLETPSFGVGFISLVLAWGALAVLYGAFGLTQARRANPSTYCELRDLLIELRGTFFGSWKAAADPSNMVRAAACSQFVAYTEAVRNGLEDSTAWGRTVWVLQMGYVSAWQLLHRAQESLVNFEDRSCVALRARYDQLRLTGARIDNKDALAKDLEQALLKLAGNTAEPNHTPSLAECEPRLVVATVRRTLNEYVDENRAGLVRARMHLTCTTTLCGLIGYAVLWLAIAAGARNAQLEAAAAFFAVGALVGLVSRLHSEIGNDTAVEDFGLSGARLLAGPQLSGLAAVLGVGLLALLGVSLGPAGSTTSLAGAFQLSGNPISIVTAAVFGLTPGLLIERLKQQTDGLKQNLRSAEPQVTHAR